MTPRMHFLLFRLVSVLVLLCWTNACQQARNSEPTSGGGSKASLSKDPYNVLFIAIDDLRPELGCFGASHILSPNLDAVAATGIRFDRHYAQVPTCGASRYSMLTGRRPKTPRHYGNAAFATFKGGLDDGPLPMPNAFRRSGYTTVCLGKITHTMDGLNANGTQQIPEAWDRTPTEPGAWRENKHLLHGYAKGRKREAGVSPILESLEVGDEDYPDGILAEQAIASLERLASEKKPFFLAVGFFKPHLPFAAPKKYWDLYDEAKIPLSPHPDKPTDLPKVNGWVQSGEVTGNYRGAGYEDRQWSEAERRRLRHGYFACVSYVDAQVGKLLDALGRLKLTDDTIIVVWGDHGWHLGDQALFGKHTTFEAALRSALIVRVPGQNQTGQVSHALVESLDIYPTLAALCGIEYPADLPGKSFVPTLLQPTKAHRDSARSYWSRGKRLAVSDRTATERTVTWTDRKTGKTLGVEHHDFSSDH